MSMDHDGSSDSPSFAASGLEIATLDVLDHEHVEWERVHRTAYLIHQYFGYRYPGPIEDLNHSLTIVPPERHLDQRRVVYRLDVSVDESNVVARNDSFGNLVLDLHVPYVPDAIDFEAWIVVERRTDGTRHLDAGCLSDSRFLNPSSRTQPDETLRRAADELQAKDRGIDLARKINAWVHDRMRYAHDVTDIHTTAAEALALGQGVCQDYAHIMIALCRLCGLPARYVSGHLLGEGGTHAWVEVFLPDARDGRASVWPFDPTHDREPGLSYVTVAVGRDYSDVAPTSGTFRAAYSGRLSSRKRVGITAIDYR